MHEARELRLLRNLDKEAAKSKRQDEIKDWNSPSGPKNDLKMKMLLTCSKSCKPLMQDNLKQLRLKLVQFVLQREI